MRYRRDKHELQADGGRAWFTIWIGGPTLAAIENCRLINMAGNMRRTVVITGEPDTYFSIPAECSIGGCKVKGYVTGTEEGYVFRQVYF